MPRGFVRQMATDSPRTYTTNMSKADRRGKTSLDYLRNDRGTAVGAYSTRAKDEAPIAVPIAWTQLTPQMRSNHFTMKILACSKSLRDTVALSHGRELSLQLMVQHRVGLDWTSPQPATAGRESSPRLRRV